MCIYPLKVVTVDPPAYTVYKKDMKSQLAYTFSLKK